jgi:hypothetical protein
VYLERYLKQTSSMISCPHNVIKTIQIAPAIHFKMYIMAINVIHLATWVHTNVFLRRFNEDDVERRCSPE